MAKRTTPRAQAEDTGTSVPPTPLPTAPSAAPPARPRRSKAETAARPDAIDVQPTPTSAEPDIDRGDEPTEDDIRRRAYERYLERGGGHGMDFEDWLHAERDLKQRKNPTRDGSER